jgi:hypothetical protein
MKRELSSKQTFLLKIILPVFIIIIFAASFLMLLISSRRTEFLPLIIMFPVLLVVSLLAMRLTLMKYKKVSIDEQFLYVSNYRKEITIPVSDIADVTEVKWFRTRPITIHLKNDSQFGRKIVFTPKLNGFRIFADNPFVAELKELAANQKGERSNER